MRCKHLVPLFLFLLACVGPLSAASSTVVADDDATTQIETLSDDQTTTDVLQTESDDDATTAIETRSDDDDTTGTESAADKSEEPEKKKDKAEELTLENIFPKDGLFGPSAGSIAFSFDGRYGAYLYRPHGERRHGQDIWIVDTATSQTRRLTSASVMEDFQESARKVTEDRRKKAKEAKKKAGQDNKTGEADTGDEVTTGTEKGQEQDLGDWIGEKDHEDSRAPRYGGVASFDWATTTHTLLMVSEGDIYQFDVTGNGPERLTRTRRSVSNVQWLPDDSGFTYVEENALTRVRFGVWRPEQIIPDLKSGDSLYRYEVSPDGTRVAILAYKGTSPPEDARFSIARYRDRRMEVQEMSRPVADTPAAPNEYAVYLVEIDDPFREKVLQGEVFRLQTKQYGDRVDEPEWAPDSSRVVFSTYNQDTSEIRLMEAVFPDRVEPAENGSDGEKAERKLEPAKALYRFLHTGGPNTPRMIRPYYLNDSRGIVYLSEQSGFRHLHVFDPVYEMQEPLTRGRFEVYPIALSPDRKSMFATSTREHPSRQDVYRICLADGTMQRLAPGEGFYSDVAVSPDGKHVLGNYVRYGQPRDLALAAADDLTSVMLTDAHSEAARRWTRFRPEFFSYKNRLGQEIYGHAFLPDGWTSETARPTLIYFYGGPLGTRKYSVEGSYGAGEYFFAYYMAKKHGYVSVCIDPRGSSGYGGLFEKSNYEQVGRPQVEDLVDGVDFLAKTYNADRKRVAIHGWSFGGFQTQMCLYTEPDVFAAGIAGAGPTEWENYYASYTRPTIGTIEPGKTDQEAHSLLPLAKNLKGHLLLVHGMEDTNVLYQDTVRVYRELLKAGKETLVELFLDPTGGHGLGGDVPRLNQYRKYEQFLLRTIGAGPSKSEGGEDNGDDGDGAEAETGEADGESGDSKESQSDTEILAGGER